MLNFHGIIIGHIIGNKIMAVATLRLGPGAFLEGHQGQMIFPSLIMFNRFWISSKPNIDCLMLLQLKYFESVLIDLHNQTQIITYMLIINVSNTLYFTFYFVMIMLLHDFNDFFFFLTTSEVLCDKYPLSKTQSILHGRLAINYSEGQFGLPQSAVM